MFEFANICDFGKLFTVHQVVHMYVVFNGQINHVKQNTKLFNLLKSRLYKSTFCSSLLDLPQYLD